MEHGRLIIWRHRLTNISLNVLEYVTGISCGIISNFIQTAAKLNKKERVYNHKIAMLLLGSVSSAKEKRPLLVEVACVHSIFGVFKEKIFKYLAQV
jgi:hypothetical protein